MEVIQQPPSPSARNDAAERESGFSIAPSLDNLLNDRRLVAEEQTGMEGSAGYLRPVGRTVGVALRKRLF